MINTISCTPDKAKNLIKQLRSLQISFILWGATGVGKSEAVCQLADELNAELSDIRLCRKMLGMIRLRKKFFEMGVESGLIDRLTEF